jgi:hypothetical protein
METKTPLSRGVSSRHSRWLEGGKACLDVRRLEALICIDLPRVTRRKSPEVFAGLADRYAADDTEISSSMSSMNSISSELQQAAFYMMQIVNDSNLALRISPPLLSEMHSFCGLIYDLNHDSHSAMQSHLRAVWLARKQNRCNKDQVEASTSRLVALCVSPTQKREKPKYSRSSSC